MAQHRITKQVRKNVEKISKSGKHTVFLDFSAKVLKMYTVPLKLGNVSISVTLVATVLFILKYFFILPWIDEDPTSS